GDWSSDVCSSDLAVGQRLETSQLPPAGRVVGAGGDHAVDGVHSPEGAGLGAGRVEVEGARDHLALAHESSGALDHVGRDEVERPDLVLGTPAPPVAELLAVFLEQ